MTEPTDAQLVITDDITRRTLLAASVSLPLIGGTAACAEPAATSQHKDTPMLVAYVTRSGNTRVIAGTIHRALHTDLFEIQAADPYPEDYEATVERARQERDRGFEPALAGRQPDIGRYDAIFLGFPTWGETTPPVVRSFLKRHDFRGRTIRPFITHGGYGIGNSLSVLASHAPGARIETPFVLEADQERRTLNQVNGWLKDTGQA